FAVNSGTIKNVHLTDASITANQNPTVGVQNVGTLVGVNYGLIKHVSASGTIDGGTKPGVAVGGLVGRNLVQSASVLSPDKDEKVITSSGPGVIRNSSANVNITVGNGCFDSCPNGGQNFVGGLVGINAAIVSHSSASGNVSSGSASSIGGLVGENVNFLGVSF